MNRPRPCYYAGDMRTLNNWQMQQLTTVGAASKRHTYCNEAAGCLFLKKKLANGFGRLIWPGRSHPNRNGLIGRNKLWKNIS